MWGAGLIKEGGKDCGAKPQIREPLQTALEQDRNLRAVTSLLGKGVEKSAGGQQGGGGCQHADRRPRSVFSGASAGL